MSDRSHMPRAREDGLVVEELDGELLIYDSQSNLAHALEGEAAAVWRACDGSSDTHTLAARCSISEEDVQMTLARLGELGLLETPDGERDGDTRRTALRKIAIGGAGLASASAVSSILVPAAAHAQSCTPGGECFTTSSCCPGTHPVPVPPSPTCPLQVLCCVPAGSCAPQIVGLFAPETTCCNPGNYIPDGTCSSGVRCL